MMLSTGERSGLLEDCVLCATANTPILAANYMEAGNITKVLSFQVVVRSIWSSFFGASATHDTACLLICFQCLHAFLFVFFARFARIQTGEVNVDYVLEDKARVALYQIFVYATLKLTDLFMADLHSFDIAIFCLTIFLEAVKGHFCARDFRSRASSSPRQRRGYRRSQQRTTHVFSRILTTFTGSNLSYQK